MNKNIMKLTAAITAVTVIFTSINTKSTYTEAADNSMVAHSVEAGESKEGNPLKGFLCYESSANLPISMEWFYLPVNAVQTGMNTFDWSALEDKLDAVAARGHQAIFRLYYDYPNEKTGIPQFLLDAGLQTKYYSDYNDIGGEGYCPDYSDTNFRQSMKNLIREFGNKYDGDGRIAYITVGLLGFWGEWHNYPFDSDGSNHDDFFVISTEVQKEVLDEFDAAFKVTRLCVREPKSGINYDEYNIGFHDDSFAYATLSTEFGGQDWSFMSKIKNFGLGEVWKRECIGGEIYPPSQRLVFSGSQPNGGNFQDWSACLSEAHPTWMLNNAIISYSGSELENARKAAVGMGYDFQVDKAYYKDEYYAGEQIRVGIDLKNIGIAPFYYGHELWPVQIALIRDNTVIYSKNTDWDLCDVQAGGSLYFETSFEEEISAGNYEIGLKVINPVSNGATLGFANKEMGDDGWLNIGQINVCGEDSTFAEESSTYESTTEVISNQPEVIEYKAWQDNEFVYVSIPVNNDYSNYQVMIDTDASADTGMIYSGMGIDYMVESDIMYSHPTNDTNWQFEKVSGVVLEKQEAESGFVVKIGKNSLGQISDAIQIKVNLLDSSWNKVEDFPIIQAQLVKEEILESEDIFVDGFQISMVNKGIRTVYSVADQVEGQDVQNVGLIYGIAGELYNPEDMVIGSCNTSVRSYFATDKGILPEVISKDKSYAMTMKFAGATQKEFTHRFYVRVFAQLTDGSYAYGTINEYTVYEIADCIYRNGLVNNNENYEYIYDNILKIANPEYEKLSYNNTGWELVR